MDRIDKATASPVEMEFSGKKWMVSPLTFRDLGSYMAWLRQRVMAETMKALAMLDPESRKAVGQDALREAQNPTPQALEARGSGPDADLYLAWLSLRKNLPNLTIDDVSEQMPNLADVQAVASKAAELGGGKISAEVPKGEPF